MPLGASWSRSSASTRARTPPAPPRRARAGARAGLASTDRRRRRPRRRRRSRLPAQTSRLIGRERGARPGQGGARRQPHRDADRGGRCRQDPPRPRPRSRRGGPGRCGWSSWPRSTTPASCRTPSPVLSASPLSPTRSGRWRSDRRPPRAPRARHVRAPRRRVRRRRPPPAAGLPRPRDPGYQPPAARRRRRGGLAGAAARHAAAGHVGGGDRELRGRPAVRRSRSARAAGLRRRRDERGQRRRHLPGARRAPAGDRARRGEGQGAVAGRHPRSVGRSLRAAAEGRPGRRRAAALVAGGDPVELRPARRRSSTVPRSARCVHRPVQPRRRRPGRRRWVGRRSAGPAHGCRRAFARRPRRRRQLPPARLAARVRPRATRRRGPRRRRRRPVAPGQLARRVLRGSRRASVGDRRRLGVRRGARRDAQRPRHSNGASPLSVPRPRRPRAPG